MQTELTSCQNTAIEALRGTENIFVTGAAGSGKSFLINQFLKEKDLKQFPVLASTGAAAVLVGGRTFHSFFGLGILEGGVEQTIERAARNRQVVRRLKEIKGFILDEVSMLSGPTLRAAEVLCRRVRASDEPWGGLRVVMVGDFAQLPPIDRNSYNRPWAFLDPVWEWSGMRVQFMETQTRVQDAEYMKILNYVRQGLVNAEVKTYLDSRLIVPGGDWTGTRLFPRRDETERYNLERLSQLAGEAKVYESVYSGNAKSVEQLKKSAPIAEELRLKVGALVMLRQNDPQGRWVNGSTGTIVKIGAKYLLIELLNGRMIEIEKASFSLLDADGDVVAAVTNYPVSLAWATTIHKSQGATLDRMWVNLKNLWEPGQAYVALSRVCRGTDLFIEAWTPNSIKVDADVVRFYTQRQG